MTFSRSTWVVAARELVCTARQQLRRCGGSCQRRTGQGVLSSRRGNPPWPTSDNMKPISVLPAVLAFSVAEGGCTTSGRKPWTSPTPACAFDSECPGGSCQAGSCSQATVADRDGCAFDVQCPGGSCQFGRCSPFPPASPSCAFDVQCPGGSCQFGTCSPFPRSPGTCVGLECR